MNEFLNGFLALCGAAAILFVIAFYIRIFFRWVLDRISAHVVGKGVASRSELDEFRDFVLTAVFDTSSGHTHAARIEALEKALAERKAGKK